MPHRTIPPFEPRVAPRSRCARGTPSPFSCAWWGRNVPRARVRATRAHCLRPDGEITFQTSPVTFNWHVPAALARSRCTVLAAWRRNTVPTEPGSVQLARLGGLCVERLCAFCAAPGAPLGHAETTLAAIPREARENRDNRENRCENRLQNKRKP